MDEDEEADGTPAEREWDRQGHHPHSESYTRMALLAEDQFDEAELTMATTGTLDLIGTWPGSTVADLSRRTPKTQQAISQIVSRLEKRGLVERRVGPGRGVGIYLTQAGVDTRAAGTELELRFE